MPTTNPTPIDLDTARKLGEKLWKDWNDCELTQDTVFATEEMLRAAITEIEATRRERDGLRAELNLYIDSKIAVAKVFAERDTLTAERDRYMRWYYASANENARLIGTQVPKRCPDCGVFLGYFTDAALTAKVTKGG